ncbi:MAG TPA: 3-oxoacyl-[acyl-carrier-protein] reductase [Candidatus Nanoarchaeia archaeon]|nr:3-oxoacyl-[acyl-carrier-protein] reductase [Candidatus Nanoarchaeia archaeon]
MLSGKIALVTGASRGIGKAIAIELAKHNAHVIVNYSSNQKDAEEVVGEIKNLGKNSISIKADVSNPEEVKKMFGEIQSRFGRLDVLVNNAGITKDRSLWKMTPEEWNRVINVNLDSIYLVTKNALSLMQKDSRIISISSIVGLYGNFGQCNYAASKAGIIGFTKSLAKEVAKQQITVNAIAPGFIESEMTDKIPFLKKKVTLWMIPMKRAGLPEEIANVAVFLASEKSSYITGQTINVNGGFAF